MTKEELTQEITAYFHERIPFNTLLGIEVVEASAQKVILRLPMKPELVGNTHHRILHGGVTATLLDVAGGLAAMINTIEKLTETDTALVRKRLQHVGTIDMRVDYLLPGLGREFQATAEVLRHGHRVAVTRMEMRSDRNRVIALGTATYMVG
jgi:uncharacterized protein (TIGR00369 family)